MVATSPRGRRAKGRWFQNLVRSYFTLAGYETMVRPLGEEGDDLRLAELPMLSIELKCQDTPRLAEWMRQAVGQAGPRIPVLIWKKYGTAKPQDQWVTLELHQWLRVCALLRHVDPRQWETLAGSFEDLGGGQIPAAGGESLMFGGEDL